MPSLLICVPLHPADEIYCDISISNLRSCAASTRGAIVDRRCGCVTEQSRVALNTAFRVQSDPRSDSEGRMYQSGKGAETEKASERMRYLCLLLLKPRRRDLDGQKLGIVWTR